jgi:hypothetical protein
MLLTSPAQLQLMNNRRDKNMTKIIDVPSRAQLKTRAESECGGSGGALEHCLGEFSRGNNLNVFRLR